jgi:hypothetical protein
MTYSDQTDSGALARSDVPSARLSRPRLRP